MDFHHHAERGKLFKRITLVWMMWLSTEAYLWCFEYVEGLSGDVKLDAAAIVAAILTPVSGLQAAVFKFYAQHRNEGD